MSVRAFIAIEASGGVASRAASLIERLRAAEAKVNWVAPENMHWTVKFLGDVELTQTAAICQRMAAVAETKAPIPVEVAGVGAFPNRERPRTVWLGTAGDVSAFAALASAIETALEPLGFSLERRGFKPHLTLGRVRSARNMDALSQLLTRHSDFEAGSMHAEELVLFSSRLERGGPVYEPLGRAELSG